MDVAKAVDTVVARFIGTKHERDIKKLQPLVAEINAREADVRKLSDAELREKFLGLKAQVQEPLKSADPSDTNYKDVLKAALEPAIVPAFALVREAGRRFLNMRHFDVQLIGGMVLNDGKIAEMKTGEGKTLVATLPAALNALAGRGVHIVTVNDYLARRDAEWMSALYRGLGLSVGVIVHDLDDQQRQAAYNADLTYGTNNEFGFDYLRDNMKYDIAQCVQRGYQFAIVDEVDSILIDEARTPLIISGPSEESTDKYARIDKIIPKLIKEIDYTIDEKLRTATLTEEGFSKCERLLGLHNLSDPVNIELMHHVYQALRAHSLYKRDVDYVVKDGEVIIVDEFTGRQMPGRRWSDGLHQAVEAKEAVKIERENQTLATITFQNYFRMYKKLSGMTGTAETEAAEFGKIYNLDVVVIPTNRKLIREEHRDVVYRTEKEKFDAVVNGILQEDNSLASGIRHYNERGQPVLVGTISIEKSEAISELLKKAGVPHQVLNAKQHERESRIVAQAGRKGAVTVATNMAGRGNDARFALMLLGVEDLMGDACLFQKLGDGFGFFDGDGADEHGLTALVIVADAAGERIVFLEDAVDHRFELLFFCTVDDVAVLFADELAIRGDDDNVEVVDFAEFGGFRFRRAGHAGEFLVHAEIILEGDGGEGLIFALDLDGFLGFDGLMKTIGPAAAGHLAAGEFVDDDNFAVFDNVIDVALVERVRAKGLVDVVHELDIDRVGKILQAEETLALAEALFRERGGAMLFVESVVNVLDEFGDDLVDLGVFVGGFFGGAGDNQRSARFIDENGIHFVNNGELVAGLDALREVVLHVVAEIVETELVVRAVSEIGAVSCFALLVVQIVDDHSDGKPEAPIEGAHPLGVAAGQVIVHGDEMHATPGEGVEGSRQSSHERLAFTRFHFGDFAVVKDHSANELDVEVAHVQEAAAGFADQRESRHDHRVKRFFEEFFVTVVGGVGVLELLMHLRLQFAETRL